MSTKKTSRAKAFDRSKRARGYFRVAAYLFVVALAMCAVSIRSARAEVGEQALAIGRQLSTLANTTQAETTRVLVNGQAVLVGSAVSADAPTAVLDRFETHCRANLAQTPESWRSALTAENETPSEKAALFDTGVLRSGTDDGVILCFTKTSQSTATVKEALDIFARTGDLAALGAVRLAYVKPTAHGGTHVLTVWTEEGFDVRKLMFEEGKDVGGEDFAEIPRLPSSTRMMATRVDGAPYGVNVYVTPASSNDVTSFYDHAMETAGWTVLDPAMDAETGGAGRAYERDGMVLTMHVLTEEGRTFIALGFAGVAARDKSAAVN